MWEDCQTGPTNGIYNLRVNLSLMRQNDHDIQYLCLRGSRIVCDKNKNKTGPVVGGRRNRVVGINKRKQDSQPIGHIHLGL